MIGEDIVEHHFFT